MKRLAVLTTVAALAAGCVTDESPWRAVGGKYDSGNWFGPRISMPLPADWMKRNRVEDGLVATRDGFNLQQIAVDRVDPDEPLAHTKKKVTKGMRPSELAEVLLDDLRAGGGLNGLKVVDTRPVTIGGSPGFRTTVAFKDGFGLRMKAVLAGTIVEDRGFRITYVAPARHYFDQDLATFDAALAGVVIK
jgi:hypothetical protein